jgi:hypothetical protein
MLNTALPVPITSGTASAAKDGPKMSPIDASWSELPPNVI